MSALILIVVPGITQAQSSVAAYIRLQYATFDPLMGEPDVSGERMRLETGNLATYLLQFTGPVHDGWKTSVEGAGVSLYGYIPDYAFITRMDGATAEKVRALPFVRWVGRYHPIYRLAPSLRASKDIPHLEVSVLTLPDVDLGGIAAKAQAWGGSLQAQSASALDGYLRVILPTDRLNDLAALEGVIWVEPYIQMELYNDEGGGTIMRADNVRSSLGLYGSGQIVGVADTGLDVGTTAAAMSDDFEGRILAGIAVCDLFAGGRDTWNDFDGHGTHVAGSMLGSGQLSGSNPAAHQYTGYLAGVAPEAQLVFQSIDNAPGGGLECIPSNMTDDLFKPAYDQGARIHNNSWGGPTGGDSNPYGGYDEEARQVDLAAWTYKDMLLLFAAGNSGIDANADGLVDPDSLGSPGTAKNVLTVGASENNRPTITDSYGSWWHSNYPADPISSDIMADDPDGMVAFSSRGPTDDGRIKPDVVAPGTWIISARSHDTSDEGWDVYDANYLYMGGTSMASPLTAGASALVREWLTKNRGLSKPSSALMKAVLINGAADMSPGQYTSPQEIPAQRPNSVSGWGRVDLQESLNPSSPRQIWLKDNTTGLSTGGSAVYTLTVGSLGVQIQAQGSMGVDGRWVGVKLVLAPMPAGSSAHQGGNDPLESDLAVSLVLDDGQGEELYGDNLIGNAFQFLWLNRFTPSEFPLTLNEIWVMFDGPTGRVNVGDAIDLVVYEDANGDPTDGATWLATFNETVQAVDGSWSTYTLSTPVALNHPGDVLIGVINRYVSHGFSLASWPAKLDTTASQDRSWFGSWFLAPPDPANLPPGLSFSLMDGEDAGNWMIRGYGETSGAPTPMPTLPAPSGLGVYLPLVSVPTHTGGPIRISLVWTDSPGTPSAGKALVNDLDLEIIAPGGTHYYGNTGVYTSGQCLRDNQWDACNNVEGITVPSAAYGTYTIIVHGYNVPDGPQPFALVASGDNLQESSGG